MAGNRITGGFKSYAGSEYDIYIYDAEFVASLSTNPNVFGWGSGNAWGWQSGGQGNVMGWDALDDLENPPGIQTHKVGLPGFTLEYETQNEKLFSPLMPSRLTFKLVFEDATQETFLNAMANSFEGQFLVRVTKDGELFWSGVLIPDVVQYEDQYYPYEFELTAIDGLSRLKSIEYPADAINADKETLLAIIFTCLGNLETNGFYGASDDYFINNVDWWNSLHGTTAGDDPLALSRINSGVLYDADPTGEDFEFFSCYQVLEQIALVFGARMYHADGKWWFMQATEYKYSGQQQRIYTKAAVMTFSINGKAYDIECNQISYARTKGRYEFAPPLKKAVITYKHRSGNGTLLNGAQWTWETDGTTYSVGTVSSNAGAAKIKFRCTIEHTFKTPVVPNPPDPDVQPYADPHYFRIELKVGSYYLSGTPSTVSEWTTTPSFYTWESVTAYVEENYIDLIEFITPPLPVDGACTIKLLYYETLIWDDTVPGGNYLDTLTLNPASSHGIAYWTQYSPLLVVLADGNDTTAINFTRYIASNTNTTNTQIEEATVFLGDGPTVTTLSKIEVYNGTTWVDSSELWGIGTGGARTQKLLELLAAQIVTMQSTPRLKYQGTLIVNNTTLFHAYNRLKINTKYYLFIGGTFEANPDEWSNIHLFYVGDGTDDPVSSEEAPVGVMPG